MADAVLLLLGYNCNWYADFNSKIWLKPENKLPVMLDAAITDFSRQNWETDGEYFNKEQEMWH